MPSSRCPPPRALVPFTALVYVPCSLILSHFLSLSSGDPFTHQPRPIMHCSRSFAKNRTHVSTVKTWWAAGWAGSHTEDKQHVIATGNGGLRFSVGGSDGLMWLH